MMSVQDGEEEAVCKVTSSNLIEALRIFLEGPESLSFDRNLCHRALCSLYDLRESGWKELTINTSVDSSYNSQANTPAPADIVVSRSYKSDEPFIAIDKYRVRILGPEHNPMIYACDLAPLTGVTNMRRICRKLSDHEIVSPVTRGEYRIATYRLTKHGKTWDDNMILLTMAGLTHMANKYNNAMMQTLHDRVSKRLNYNEALDPKTRIDL